MDQRSLTELCNKHFGENSEWRVQLDECDRSIYITYEPTKKYRRKIERLGPGGGFCVRYWTNAEKQKIRDFIELCKTRLEYRYVPRFFPYCWFYFVNHPDNRNHQINSVVARRLERKEQWIHKEILCLQKLGSNGLKTRSLVELKETCGNLPKGWQGYVIEIFPEEALIGVCRDPNEKLSPDMIPASLIILL